MLLKILPMWKKITTNLVFLRNEEKTNFFGLGFCLFVFFESEIEKAIFTPFFAVTF